MDNLATARKDGFTTRNQVNAGASRMHPAAARQSRHSAETRASSRSPELSQTIGDPRLSGTGNEVVNPFSYSLLRTSQPSSFVFERWLRVFALEGSVFRALVADKQARWQAALSILAVSIATAVGVLDDSGPGIFASTMVTSVLGWFVWSILIYFVITKTPDALLANGADLEFGDVAKVIAFAQMPALLRAFGIFGSVGPMVAILSILWVVVAMTVAVNQSFQLRSAIRSFAVVSVTFIPYILIVGVFTLVTTL